MEVSVHDDMYTGDINVYLYGIQWRSLVTYRYRYLRTGFKSAALPNGYGLAYSDAWHGFESYRYLLHFSFFYLDLIYTSLIEVIISFLIFG